MHLFSHMPTSQWPMLPTRSLAMPADPNKGQIGIPIDDLLEWLATLLGLEEEKDRCVVWNIS